MKYRLALILCARLMLSAGSASAQAPAPTIAGDAQLAVPAESAAPVAGPAPAPPGLASAPAAPAAAPAVSYAANVPSQGMEYAEHRRSPDPRSIDASDYRRNRIVAGIGKVLTVIAPGLLVAFVATHLDDEIDPDDSVGLIVAWYATGLAGRLTWAGADLKMTNMLVRSGVPMRRGAAISSMVFAGLSWVPYVGFLATPGTWIAGGLASARIREAHRELGPLGLNVMPAPAIHGRGLSAGMTLRF